MAVVDIMKIKPQESQNPFSKQAQREEALPTHAALHNILWKIYVMSLLSHLDQNRHEIKTSNIKMRRDVNV